ncbi:MAG: NUDIX domain-containing protein [Bacteroidia bacterium]|nr:MAG: NUDIX domain-containing protein [Bacteroidia bacterium]
MVCDEYWFDTLMTKFPGGGMEYGEGTIDCLRRECMEELGQQVEVLSHFYTTDFFQATRFIADKQLISIYYRIALSDPAALAVSDEAYDFYEKKEGAIRCRWIPMNDLNQDSVTFPIDRKVVAMLLEGKQGV